MKGEPTMKRVLAAVFAMLMLLTACNNDSLGTPSVGKKPDNETNKVFSSTIFGRNVSYNAITPSDDLGLPLPSGDILDMVQIDEKLYFLGDGGVFSLDIATAESKRLFDTDASSLTAHGKKLYLISSNEQELIVSEYDALGAKGDERALSADGIDIREKKLYVTDDYYLIILLINNGKTIDTYLYTYSRETGEQLLTEKMSSGLRLFPYKENMLLSLTPDSVLSGFNLGSLDAESCKIKRIRRLDSLLVPAVAYRPQTDTVLSFCGNMGDESPCCITEYSLEDDDMMIHSRNYLDVFDDTDFFLGVHENIVTALLGSGDSIITFDFLNPPDSITICGNMINSEVIYSFEKTTGILVRQGNMDSQKLTLKLLAGDSDFDIFQASSGFHNFVNSDSYVDLTEIDSLRKRIEENAAARFVVSYDEKYFGVPTMIDDPWSEEMNPEDGSPASYSILRSEQIYYAYNIDISEKRYSDPDGDELYKLLRFIHDNPGGNKGKMPFGDDITILNGAVYLLNPKSENRENAVRFLEYVLDVFSGKIPGVVSEELYYPELESLENCYVQWKCRPLELIGPVLNARNQIIAQGDSLSSGDIKKLARETAAQVAMMIGE